MSDKKSKKTNQKNRKRSKNQLVKSEKVKFSKKHPKLAVALRIIILLLVMVAGRSDSTML